MESCFKKKEKIHYICNTLRSATNRPSIHRTSNRRRCGAPQTDGNGCAETYTTIISHKR